MAWLYRPGRYLNSKNVRVLREAERVAGKRRRFSSEIRFFRVRDRTVLLLVSKTTFKLKILTEKICKSRNSFGPE